MNRSPGRSSGPDAIYIIALAKQLPSEIPSLDQIRDRVARDYQLQEGLCARNCAGTNFAQTLQAGWPAGKSFSSECAAAGLPPRSLAAVFSEHASPAGTG